MNHMMLFGQQEREEKRCWFICQERDLVVPVSEEPSGAHKGKA